jgi:hypothetical protein
MHTHMPHENPRRTRVRKIRRRKNRLPLEVGPRNLKLAAISIGAENEHALNGPNNQDEVAAIRSD